MVASCRQHLHLTIHTISYRYPIHSFVYYYARLTKTYLFYNLIKMYYSISNIIDNNFFFRWCIHLLFIQNNGNFIRKHVLFTNLLQLIMCHRWIFFNHARYLFENFSAIPKEFLWAKFHILAFRIHHHQDLQEIPNELQKFLKFIYLNSFRNSWTLSAERIYKFHEP